MAKRLRPETIPLEVRTNGRPDRCRNCGGAIEIEDRELPQSRYPRRRLCRLCGTEHGTTRPAIRNY